MAGSEPAYVKTFKQYAKTNLNENDLEMAEQEFYGESPRALVILQASLVESALYEAMLSALRPDITSTQTKALFDPDAPLGTFSAKIKIGTATALFGSQTFHDLGLIRIMRNGFAHSLKPLGWETKEVIDLCSHLRLPDSKIRKVPQAYYHLGNLGVVLKPGHPKTRFVASCHTIAIHLLKFAWRRDRTSTLRSDLP